jgi:hypothetical protein
MFKLPRSISFYIFLFAIMFKSLLISQSICRHRSFALAFSCISLAAAEDPRHGLATIGCPCAYCTAHFARGAVYYCFTGSAAVLL